MPNTEIAPDFAAGAQPVIDHVNNSYEDSVLFIARILCGQRDAVAARIDSADATGLDVVTVDAGGVESRARLDFPAPIDEPADISRAAIGLVMRAHAESGEAGETSAERQVNRMRTIRTMLTTVSAVEVVHPHLRRITFAGGDLATFSPLGPDTFLYVLLPPPGRAELTIDQSFTWDLYNEMPVDERPVGAYYTLRDWRPDVAEFDMLFVLHEPAGPASEWATRAQVGDPVALWGPREAFEPPADADQYFLVVDDTGLPAAAVIIESLPTGTSVHLVAEVDNADERQPIAQRGGVTVNWVYRNGRAPGIDHEPMLAAVRAALRPSPTTFVWGGGESRAVTAVRKYARHELGMLREQVSLVGYWRHANTSPDFDDDAD